MLITLRVPVLLFLVSLVFSNTGGPPPSGLNIIYSIKTKDEEE